MRFVRKLVISLTVVGATLITACGSDETQPQPTASTLTSSAAGTSSSSPATTPSIDSPSWARLIERAKKCASSSNSLLKVHPISADPTRTSWIQARSTDLKRSVTVYPVYGHGPENGWETNATFTDPDNPEKVLMTTAGEGPGMSANLWEEDMRTVYAQISFRKLLDEQGCPA